MRTVKSGNWEDASVWDTLSGPVEIQAGHTVKINGKATVNNVNVVVRGTLRMRAGDFLQFINIDENRFVGGGLVVLDTDIGLWIMGNGLLDAVGTYKKTWSWSTGSIKKGAKSLSVKDATGWKVGDEIVICPTRDPGENTFNYDDQLGIQDSFFPEFERRIITAISGNTISFNTALAYDHDEVTDPVKPTVTPPVGNLTNDVRIEGTAKGRTHIFIHSHVPQTIKNVSIKDVGPRKVYPGHGRDRPILISGRYGLHFHHGGKTVSGTVVDSCVVYDCGNRCFVPHMVVGVTISNCFAFNSLESQYWWDWQELSHNITYDGNLGAACRLNGIDSKAEAMVLNMGDSNTAKNNVMVYGNNGDESGSGAYSWHANSEGIWTFTNNMAIASRSAFWGWQNSGNNHVIRESSAVNCTISMFWGAYLSPYQFIDCTFINSVTRIVASAANPVGMLFLRCYFNNNNKKPFNVMVQDSPIPSFTTNKFVDCTFKGATTAHVRHFTAKRDTDNDKMHKMVDLISPTYDGNLFVMDDYSTAEGKYTMLDGNRLRVQPKSGQPYQVSIRNRQPVRNDINKFSTTVWGTGQGFKGDYFWGTNFNEYLFTRLDAAIQYDSWNQDMNITQTEVHYKIFEHADKEKYSIRWSGFIEGQFSEPYIFTYIGAGGFRLWVDDVLILDSWNEKDYTTVLSKPVNLTAGKKHKFIAEHFNDSGWKGCSLKWKCPSMEEISYIASSQAYSDLTTLPPPPPQVFKSSRKSKDFTRNNCPTGQTGNAYTYVVDAGQFESTISQGDADGKADADIAAKGQNQANQFGTCKNITMPTPCEEFKAADYLIIWKDLRDAGITTATALQHYNTHGKTERRRANLLCRDPNLLPSLAELDKIIAAQTPVPPTKTLTKTIKVYSDGSVEVA